MSKKIAPTALQPTESRAESLSKALRPFIYNATSAKPVHWLEIVESLVYSEGYTNEEVVAEMNEHLLPHGAVCGSAHRFWPLLA